MIVPYARRRQPGRWTWRRAGAVALGLAVLASVAMGGIVVISLAGAPEGASWQEVRRRAREQRADRRG